MGKGTVLLALCTLMFGAIQAESVEYFVGKNGNDTNSGWSREDAFLTIQKGINALKPGDTLTIGRGEYFENVASANLGNDSADTVIRAEIAGTLTTARMLRLSGWHSPPARPLTVAAMLRLKTARFQGTVLRFRGARG